MENNYSYAEFMKAVGRNSSSIEAEKLLNEIYMDLFLNRIHREQTKERLMVLINHSLDCLDEQSFLKYSDQLAQFNEIV
ncbi:IDEAL domain-containing protein [Sporosarcina sp. FA9]|uniref:IDEAL domain-containing protein n=1 Tax=Sporosarcina sp. FA9 TaxID=3413030 RepID=UPI003F65F6B2